MANWSCACLFKNASFKVSTKLKKIFLFERPFKGMNSGACFRNRNILSRSRDIQDFVQKLMSQVNWVQR